MSLRSKIVLILVTVVVGYSAVDNGTLRIFADHAFGRWEREVAEEDLARVRRRIDAELEDLCGKGRVHAGVAELGSAVARKDPAFVASHFGRPAMERAGVDLFYVCDANGRVLWG